MFEYADTSTARLFINPDLWMYLELEEKNVGQGLWWDPRRGVDALVRRILEERGLETVEIKIHHLLKYLRARQMSLLIGHYRQLLLVDPSQSAVDAFVTTETDVILGSPKAGVKAILQNWGLRRDMGSKSYLQRRLHLWLEIRPPAINAEDPWGEERSFDPFGFTLPTRAGQVCPARWGILRYDGHRNESPVNCATSWIGSIFAKKFWRNTRG